MAGGQAPAPAAEGQPGDPGLLVDGQPLPEALATRVPLGIGVVERGEGDVEAPVQAGLGPEPMDFVDAHPQFVQRREGRAAGDGRHRLGLRERHPSVGQEGGVAPGRLGVAAHPDGGPGPLDRHRHHGVAVGREVGAVAVLTDFPLHAADMASMASSNRFPRVAKSAPSTSNSARRYPAPIPTMTRPPDRTSRLARSGGQVRVPVAGHQQVGPQPDGRGHGGHGAEGHERVEGVMTAVGQPRVLGNGWSVTLRTPASRPAALLAATGDLFSFPSRPMSRSA